MKMSILKEILNVCFNILSFICSKTPDTVVNRSVISEVSNADLDVSGHVMEVLSVPLGQYNMGDSSPVGSHYLLFDPTNLRTNMYMLD